jgi:glyoxylate reductase
MADLPMPSEIIEMLTPHVTIVDWPDGPREDTAGLYTFGHPPVTRELLDRLPGLKVISNHGVGVDHIDVLAARERGIPVGNTPDVLNGAVADLAMALMLSSARRIVEGQRIATSARTGGPTFLGTEVHGSTLGIVGLGRVGREIARRALAFDMRCLYHNRTRDPRAEAHLHVAYAGFIELLSQCDFVIVSVPLTAATTRMFDDRAFSAMKPTATFINVARGAVVDTKSLTRALRENRIAAAALDVTDPEPLPSDHPLCGMSNVTLTPHIGSATRTTRQSMARLSVENLLRGLRGEPLAARVTE